MLKQTEKRWLNCSLDLEGLNKAVCPLKTYVNSLSALRAKERKAPFKAWLAKNRIPPSLAAAQRYTRAYAPDLLDIPQDDGDEFKHPDQMRVDAEAEAYRKVWGLLVPFLAHRQVDPEVTEVHPPVAVPELRKALAKFGWNTLNAAQGIHLKALSTLSNLCLSWMSLALVAFEAHVRLPASAARVILSCLERNLVERGW